MATGKVVTGIFQPIELTGSIANVNSHQSGGCAITSTTVKINGVSQGTWTSSLYSDYLFIIRHINTGHQHFLLQACYPNASSGNVITIWNCNDSKLTNSFSISGFLIPKSLCQLTNEATLYKQYIYKEYGVSSSVTVPSTNTKTLEIKASSFSYSIPSGYRVIGLTDIKSGSTNCAVVRFEPYISDSNSITMKLYNFSGSNASATPGFRVIFTKTAFNVYV